MFGFLGETVELQPANRQPVLPGNLNATGTATTNNSPGVILPGGSAGAEVYEFPDQFPLYKGPREPIPEYERWIGFMPGRESIGDEMVSTGKPAVTTGVREMALLGTGPKFTSTVPAGGGFNWGGFWDNIGQAVKTYRDVEQIRRAPAPAQYPAVQPIVPNPPVITRQPAGGGAADGGAADDGSGGLTIGNTTIPWTYILLGGVLLFVLTRKK
jgi:hypothetical protein